MPRAATEGASPSSLAPMAVAAVGILALALVISGVLWKSHRGTIVVERITWTAYGEITTTATGGFTDKQPVRTAVTSVTETSADGTPLRSLISSSTMRPGFQDLSFGNTIELYDPTTDTIYETTDQALQRAVVAQVQRNAPPGTHVSSGKGTGRVQYAQRIVTYPSFAPGSISIPEQQLRAGLYRLGRRTTIDGRPAIELVPTHATVRFGVHSAIRETIDPVYVSPRTFDPIEEVIRFAGGGQKTWTVMRWPTYRVLPATTANLRRLSLTALHPHARVVRSASGYLQANNAGTRTQSIRTG